MLKGANVSRLEMKHNLQIVVPALDSIDLKDLWVYANWHSFFQFFNNKAGDEHYRLLSNFSWQFPPNTVLADIGTSGGFSALALAHNPNVKVITYNIEDGIGKQVCSMYDKKNIEPRFKNCIEDIDELVKCPFILLDTAHEGGFERELITALMCSNYKGVVMCDDIYLNRAMIDFWNWVPLKKMDVSEYGHWSGTGIILFDPASVNIETVPIRQRPARPTV
jgi:hypothetical protein